MWEREAQCMSTLKTFVCHDCHGPTNQTEAHGQGQSQGMEKVSLPLDERARIYGHVCSLVHIFGGWVDEQGLV
jgi:hypothetical protein